MILAIIRAAQYIRDDMLWSKVNNISFPTMGQKLYFQTLNQSNILF